MPTAAAAGRAERVVVGSDLVGLAAIGSAALRIWRDFDVKHRGLVSARAEFLCSL
jgi:hypothetical protein